MCLDSPHFGDHCLEKLEPGPGSSITPIGIDTTKDFSDRHSSQHISAHCVEAPMASCGNNVARMCGCGAETYCNVLCVESSSDRCHT